MFHFRKSYLLEFVTKMVFTPLKTLSLRICDKNDFVSFSRTYPPRIRNMNVFTFGDPSTSKSLQKWKHNFQCIPNDSPLLRQCDDDPCGAGGKCKITPIGYKCICGPGNCSIIFLLFLVIIMVFNFNFKDTNIVLEHVEI